MSKIWRPCSVCKKDIAEGGSYYVCSVSSCHKSAFCSVSCWDVHSGVMSHKDSAGAEEQIAGSSGPRRILVGSPNASSTRNDESAVNDILIVASKLKNYVREKHGLNTSADVIEKLSDIVRTHCDQAVENAKTDGRKTLMERDF